MPRRIFEDFNYIIKISERFKSSERLFMRLMRAIGILLLVIHCSWAKFDPCRFNFGVKLGASWDGVDLVAQYTYSGSGLENDVRQMLVDCKNAQKTPALYMYVIAKSSGLGDCNTGGGLCDKGAAYIRDNKERIKGIYKNYASAIKGAFGTEDPVLLIMEPDYYQYAQPGTQGGSGGPLSFAEAGEFIGECIDVVKAELPNAWISLDISPWIEDQGQTASWFNSLPLDKADFMNTSGGVSAAASSLIKTDNRLTWKKVHDLTGKCIIADAGYGVGGGGTGHDNAWDDVSNLNNRIGDGVVAIIQFSPKGGWVSTINSIGSQLSKPICPCSGIGKPSYSLTIETGSGGTVEASPEEESYKEGTEVTLTAKPSSGYVFAGWAGDAAGNDPTIKITMDKDKKVLAEFREDNGVPTFSLTVTTSGSGMVEVMPKKSYYDSGTVVTLEIRLVNGATFNGWSGDASGKEYAIALVMDGNKTIAAAFSGEDLKPAVNLVKNGDFSSGTGNWDLGVYDNARANGSVENGAYKISISSPGGENWNIQLTQGGIVLQKNEHYILSFKASAQSTATIIANVGMSADPWTSYSTEKEITLTTEAKTYTIPFTMNAESTSDARIEFNSGTCSSTWQIDDIKLEVEMTIEVKESRPFPDNTGVAGVIDADDEVSVTWYDHSGRLLGKKSGTYGMIGRRHYLRQAGSCIAVIRGSGHTVVRRVITLSR